MVAKFGHTVLELNRHCLVDTFHQKPIDGHQR